MESESYFMIFFINVLINIVVDICRYIYLNDSRFVLFGDTFGDKASFSQRFETVTPRW
jgi:uncharacterized membrane protein YfhO